MREETYLNIFLSPAEMSYDIKKIIIGKLKDCYLFKEIDYKTYKKGDIIHGELFANDSDDRVFVISYDIICEILNTDILPKIRSKNHVRVHLESIKNTNGCMYFLGEGNIII